MPFLPTPEMLPMRLPCKLRYRLLIQPSVRARCVCELGYPNWVVPRSRFVPAITGAFFIYSEFIMKEL